MAVVVSVEDCGDCSAVAADGGEKQFEVEAALRVGGIDSDSLFACKRRFAVNGFCCRGQGAEGQAASEFFGRCRKCETLLVEDYDVVDQIFDFPNLMRRDQDRPFFVRIGGQQASQGCFRGNIQSVRRFIQQQYIGVAGQCEGDVGFLRSPIDILRGLSDASICNAEQ